MAAVTGAAIAPPFGTIVGAGVGLVAAVIVSDGLEDVGDTARTVWHSTF